MNDKKSSGKNDENLLPYSQPTAALSSSLVSQSSMHVSSSSAINNQLLYGSTSVNSFNNVIRKRDQISGLSTSKQTAVSPSRASNHVNKSLGFEIPSPLSQSISEEKSLLGEASNRLEFNKNLREEDPNRADCYFEKPSLVGDETLNNTTIEFNESTKKSPTKSILNKETKISNKESIINNNASNMDSQVRVNYEDAEFKDCLKLLSQAEKKVQNRTTSPNKYLARSNQIPDKYFMNCFVKSNTLDDVLFQNAHSANSSISLLPCSNQCNCMLDASFTSANKNNANSEMIKNNLRLLSLPNRMRKYSSLERNLNSNQQKNNFNLN